MMILQFVILQIIVFGAVIYFLKKILYTDTQSAVSRLDRVYQDLLAKQKELNVKIEQAEKDYKQKKDEGEKIADKLRQETMDSLREQEDKILKEAKSQADEIVAKARASSDKIYREIEKDVKLKTVDFAGDILRNSISAEVLKIFHGQMIHEFLLSEKTLDFSSVSPDVTKFAVRTPFPLAPEDIEKITSMVKRKLGRSLESEETKDETLVAGVALQFGTLVLDGSYANRINEAALEVRKKIELQA